MGELEPRCQILVEYAKWTAFSAVRRGPIRAPERVYELLGGVAFSRVLNPSLGPISCKDFNCWHRAQTKGLCARATPMLSCKWVKAHGSEFPVGWGAKLINVYLKTAAYVGDRGREGLRDVLHPPLDNRLKDHLAKCFQQQEYPEIHKAVKFPSISAITAYEKSADTDAGGRRRWSYERIIDDGCRAAAEVLGCSLFEVEQLWSDLNAPLNPLPRCTSTARPRERA